ncbi:hypothetical protein OE88DRAFT_1248624 [Heliocybe sulcata]|uniref:C2H2-type domain-containing protein n=1 Tax=Heliocybe sulcata TaxID=5364 RepID=A0A5C3N7Y1_9AGAM|nr:hypothetical protein OE88DRAFT_1248624 [Heliocybe sulcata]
MNHSETAFSIDQLLGFKVCLDFTDVSQPPRLSFETVKPPKSSRAWQSTSMRGLSPLIKFETTHLAIDGRCILKVYAVGPTSEEASTSSPDASLLAGPDVYRSELDAQYNSGSPCPSRDALQPHAQGHKLGYTVSPKMEDSPYLPTASPHLDQSWSHLINQGYETTSSRSHAYPTGDFGFQSGSQNNSASFMESMSMPGMSRSMSMPSSLPSSPAYAGHFATMPDPRAGGFFGAYDDAGTQSGLEYQSDALVGDPSSRPQPEMDLSRVVYASGGASPYQKAAMGVPAATRVRSDDLDSSIGSTTPSTSVYSLSERSTPEPESSSHRAEAPTDKTSGGPKRRGKARNKPSSLYIYHCPHPTCTRVFRSEYTCRVHSGVHIPKPRKVIPCTQPGCLETFTRQHDRLRHEVAQHGKICEFSCPSCHRFFSSAAMLEKHKCSSYRR